MSDFKVYEGSAAWKSMDFQTSNWIDVLNPEQRRELVDAADSLPDEDSQWLGLKREDLHLPTLSPFLQKVNKGLEEGRGFAILRGLDLPPAKIDFAYRVNWVLALGLGDVIAQNANGEVIGAVQAVTEADDNGMETRGYVSRACCVYGRHPKVAPIRWSVWFLYIMPWSVSAPICWRPCIAGCICLCAKRVSWTARSCQGSHCFSRKKIIS